MSWLDVGLAEYEMGCFRPGDDVVEYRFRSNDPPTTDTTQVTSVVLRGMYPLPVPFKVEPLTSLISYLV